MTESQSGGDGAYTREILGWRNPGGAPRRGFYRYAGSTKSENITFGLRFSSPKRDAVKCERGGSPEGRFFNAIYIRMEIDGVVPGKERVWPCVNKCSPFTWEN